MSHGASATPLQRRLLWGLLIAVMLAIAVTTLMAPRWNRSALPEPPPRLGRVPAFQLLNRDGTVVTDRSLLGRPWVANFVFTRCALSCPRMTSQMMRLSRLVGESGRPRRVSFSVDPGYDTPEVLEQYAESWGIDDSDWLFLTGETETIRTLVLEGFRLGLANDPPAEVDPREPIVHSTRFVLVDAEARIRGYYDVLQGDELGRLVADLRAVRAVSAATRE